MPLLDSYHQQASAQYWPGANSSSGPGRIASVQAPSTLPTPPTDGAHDCNLPQQTAKPEFANLATAILQQPGMPTSLEHAGATPSLTQRRPAAVNLPNFELPSPSFQGLAPHKFAPPHWNTQHNTNIGPLPTPPSTLPGETLSPVSSLLNGVNANPGASSTYNFVWPALNTGLTPLMGGASGNTPQPWPGSSNPAKGLFSPSLSSSLPRAETNSPSAGESFSPPGYEYGSLPVLPNIMGMAGPGGLQSHPIHHQQQQQQQATMQAFMAQSQSQTQTPLPAPTTQASPVNLSEPYAQRSQSTPSSFFSHSQPSSAIHSTFPPFNNQSSPIQQSPMSAPPQGSTLSPMSAQSTNFPPPSSQATAFSRASYAPFLPAMSAPAQMSAPMLANMHNPGIPMGFMGMQGPNLSGSLIPGYHSGHAAQLQQQMFNAPQQAAHNDRPFRCDQCPQSFNRNHDLKRHKRIHLAVKPFPCGYCEKSFSRKDALKVSSVLISPTNKLISLAEAHSCQRLWQGAIYINLKGRG